MRGGQLMQRARRAADEGRCGRACGEIAAPEGWGMSARRCALAVRQIPPPPRAGAVGRWLAGGMPLLCLWLAMPLPVAAEEALDRLFFTPERRQQLDRQRQSNALDQQAVQSEPTLTIDGVVTRSSGRRTAWINGIPQNEADVGSGVRVRTQRADPGRVVIGTDALPATRARVGETVNSSSGETQDLLDGGTIVVHRRPTATR